MGDYTIELLDDLPEDIEEKMQKGFVAYESRRTGGMRVRTYNGGQSQKILNQIEKITALVDANRDLTTMVWRQFRYMFEDLQDGIFRNEEREVIPKDEWNSRAIVWGGSFVRVHEKGSMRIYPHMMIYHGADVVERHGPLRDLSQQGFEATNALHGNFGHHHTDHRWNPTDKTKISATDQLMGRSFMILQHQQTVGAKRRKL